MDFPGRSASSQLRSGPSEGDRYSSWRISSFRLHDRAHEVLYSKSEGKFQGNSVTHCLRKTSTTSRSPSVIYRPTPILPTNSLSSIREPGEVESNL